jgi:hypothetical protein
MLCTHQTSPSSVNPGLHRPGSGCFQQADPVEAVLEFAHAAPYAAQSWYMLSASWIVCRLAWLCALEQ